jgi:DNA-binding MarR family transcriptional regulator
MPEEPINRVGEKSTGPRSQLGLYRAHLTSASHRSFITVGRKELLNDTLEILRGNIGKKPKHHQLFIAPRGCGKTHFLSLIEDAIEADPALGAAYEVVRFPEEARRVLGFADFLLQICEILKDQSSPGSRWHKLHERLSTEENDEVVIDTLVPAIQNEREETGRVLILMVENLHQIMEEQIKQDKSIKALRGFLMQDNGCLLIATSPLHFGALSKADQPFYDFFDIQVLDPLGAEDTIALIRRNLESDQRQDLLSRFPELLPKLRSLHTLTGGTPRLVVMLYELLSTESITEVKEQFLRLIDRITPFYQDRLNDLSPQERAVLETIATMRAEWPHEAPLKTPGNIASRMRMKSAQVSSLLARLTKGLYLVSAPNPDDGRSSLYHIREGFFDLWLAMNVSRAARQRIPLLTDFFAAVYEKDEERRQKREECAPEKRGDAVDRIKPAEPRYLEEIFDLIRQWEKGRLGDVEAFSHRFQEMGEELNDETWSALKIEFLRGKMASSPMAENRSRAENPAKSSIN